MAHQFPEIVAYGSAFRFAIEAEEAAADFAAAAASQAPDGDWQTRLDEISTAHQERAAKLRVTRQEVNEMILAPITTLECTDFLGTLDAEPVESWPGVVEQLVQAEEDAARYHDEFVAQADEVLAASARAFKKAAKQDRATAEELRSLL
jgi:hypothetical protein